MQSRFIFLHLPTKTRLKLSGQLRKKSVAVQQYKSREIMDINQNTTDKLMQKYAGSDLIHGHTLPLFKTKSELDSYRCGG
jgi:UDP-2,3-diacylglucosamine hydrolase